MPRRKEYRQKREYVLLKEEQGSRVTIVSLRKSKEWVDFNISCIHSFGGPQVTSQMGVRNHRFLAGKQNLSPAACNCAGVLVIGKVPTRF